MMKKYTAVNAPTAKLRIQNSWLMRTEKGGVSFTSTGATFVLSVGGRAGALRARADRTAASTAVLSFAVELG